MKYYEQLSQGMCATLQKMGYRHPTPIQEQTLLPLLDGRDLTGVAQTGTGKTAAFCVPIIERTIAHNHKTQALVLCPTRELAMQTTAVFRRLSAHLHLSVVSVYGGQSASVQVRALKRGTHIVVGTPGRVKDLIGRHVLKLKNVRTVVLDEADEMLDFGFLPDIEEILSTLPADHQTMLFSATMGANVASVTRRFQCEPLRVQVGAKNQPIQTVDQTVLQIGENQKVGAVCDLLRHTQPRLALVFCNTRSRVREVCKSLSDRGLSACCLHGEMRQKERDAIMRSFRTGAAKVLVATDVAARGIDVDQIDLVVNYDVPDKTEYYVHRIGRTGRAGSRGTACTLMSPRQRGKIRDIEKSFQIRLKRQELAN